MGERWPADLVVSEAEIFLIADGVPLRAVFYGHSPIVLIGQKYC